MMPFMNKNMSDHALIDHLKNVISACEHEDYKTKRFKGLLYDEIPNHLGLKTRLVIMGQSGIMEKLLKLSKGQSLSSQKIEKLARDFSKTYGFMLDQVLHTFDLCLKAMEAPVALEVQPPIDLPIGNFSKSQLEEKTPGLQIRSKEKESPAPEEKAIVGKRKNILNLIGFIFFLISMGGYLGYLWVYTDISTVGFGYLMTVDPAATLTYPWAMGVLIAIVVLVALPNLFYYGFKYNVLTLYPLILIAGQLAIATVLKENSQMYNQIQLSVWLVMVGSFIPLTLRAIRLPKSKKDTLSYKAIGAYYLTGIAFATTHILVRIFI